MTDPGENPVRRFLYVALLCAAGCSSPRNLAAIHAYYDYDFASARAAFRDDAERNNEDVVLNNLRLGLAALADGDRAEAELALGRAYELLSTAGLNRNRTTASVLLYEGVRIWKGEPFEQALAYYWIAALYAMLGDWENVRAASANALFRLTDFGDDQHRQSQGREYGAVDTDFALGFLLEAIGSDLSGASGRDEQLLAALKIDPRVAPVADAVRRRAYDTLLIVDYGQGPAKTAYGSDDSLVRFESARHRRAGDLVIRADGEGVGRFAAVCDVHKMAVDHRWNNLEDVRRAKSDIGTVLVAGGAASAVYGGFNDSPVAALAGLGAILLGALLKESAVADTRYLEFAPESVYLAPVALAGPRELEVSIAGDPGARVVLSGFEPGEPGAPRAVYLRLFNARPPPLREDPQPMRYAQAAQETP